MIPKVSIIIPVYNGSNYLKEAIDSALSQTYKNIEVIVINDGSKDNGKTAKIAKSYGTKIRYFEKKNGGVASAVNLGIQKMEGEYFSWLSHDDVYLPNKISANINFINKNPKKTILYSDFELIDPKGKHLSFLRPRPPKNQFINYLIFERFIHGCTIFVPKKAFKEVGLFNENLPNAQDYEMWFRLLRKNYVFRPVKKVLIKARLHPNQGCNLRKNLQLADEEYLYTWVLKNFSIKEILGGEEDKMFAYLNLFWKFKGTNLPQTARFSLFLALRNLHFRHFRRNFGFLFDILFKPDTVELQIK